jgi:hypothetical protein
VPKVTLRLPEELLREARQLAVAEGVSLSRLVARSLEQRVYAARAYRIARQRQLRLLSEGIELRTSGQATWRRESLHDR